MHLKNQVFFYLAGIILLSFKAATAQTDSIRVYWASPIEVTADRIYLGHYSSLTTKDNLSNLFTQNGFSLIRKGAFFAQDIYSEGFKRGDISILIDGERFPNACLNRMDSPLTRINTLEMGLVDMLKTSGIVQSGLAGAINVHRADPNENRRINLNLTGSSGATQALDFSTSIEGKRHRLTARYSSGLPFENSRRESFKELYGYRDDYRYTLAEMSFHGQQNSLAYGGGYTFTENVSFPYLLMDEIYNKAINSFISIDELKLYFNYTDHLMDNSLRKSNLNMTTMVFNFTAGLVSEDFELYYRHWNANNSIVTSTVDIKNKMMPEVSSFSARMQKKYHVGDLTILSKIGLQFNSVGNTINKDLYKTLYPNAALTRLFLSLSTLVTHFISFGQNWYMGNSLDVVAETPELEYLYVAVRKPMGKPIWLGNPGLKQPIRLTYRLNAHNSHYGQIEMYASHVWNYTYLTKSYVESQPYQTYSTVGAIFFGFNIKRESTYLDVELSYTWAENRTKKSPLMEILPLTAKTTLKSPEFSGFSGYVRATYHSKQIRIDNNLNETPTAAWQTIDVALHYNLKPLQILLEVNNVANKGYIQHLSYLRNPFSSGFKIYEPGRYFQLSIRYFSDF
jgi:iron complex outermembrane receptor protein